MYWQDLGDGKGYFVCDSINMLPPLPKEQEEQIKKAASTIKEMIKKLDIKVELPKYNDRERFYTPSTGSWLCPIYLTLGNRPDDNGSGTYKLSVSKQRGSPGSQAFRIPLEKQTHIPFRDVQTDAQHQDANLCDETVRQTPDAESQ